MGREVIVNGRLSRICQKRASGLDTEDVLSRGQLMKARCY